MSNINARLFSRFEDNAAIAAASIRDVLTAIAANEKNLALQATIDRVFDNCPYQDMGQAMVEAIYSDGNSMQIFHEMHPSHYLHAICAGYAHDALIAADKGYSDPWPLISRSLFWLGMLEGGAIYDDTAKQVRSRDSRVRANCRHDKPGGSRDKQASIQSAWASGKFENRNLCAEQECSTIGMSYESARKALRNTPDPDPWPGKKSKT